MDFPRPFGGIEYQVQFDTTAKLCAAVGQLVLCPGHRHNFAVETDSPRPSVYVSWLGAKCLGMPLDTPRAADSISP